MNIPVRKRLLSSVIAATLAATVFGLTPVLAQEAEEQASAAGEASEEALERIQVTGSRIKRAEFEGSSPVTVLDREQIERSSFVTLGDILNELPQLRSTFSLQNSGRFIGTAGAGRLDLRGLGSNRTLILINGRRHVATGIGGGQQVDTNSIPAEMIERVEVVTGANSAVSGADAVSGTVNFILRDDIEGVSTRASIGQSGDVSDFNRYSAGVTAGGLFMGGRGSSVFSLNWARQDNLTAEQRGGRFNESWGFAPNPNLDGEPSADNPSRVLTPFNRFWGISRGGTILGSGVGGPSPFGPAAQIGPNGELVTIPFDQFEVVNGLQCAGPGCADQLNLAGFQELQVALERVSLDANFQFELNPDTRLYFENRYVEVESGNQFQPSFDFAFPGALTIRRDNAFLSSSVAEAMDAVGADSFGMNRMNFDLGFRLEDVQRETFRSVVGIEGAFAAAERDWEYDVFANFGQTTEVRVNRNNRINDRWFAASDAVRLTQGDLDSINNPTLFANPNVSVGDIVCRATLQAASGETPMLPNGNIAPSFAVSGCIPANVLGDGNISQEAIDWINSTSIGRGSRQQFQAGAVLQTDELFSSWAGPVPVVVGVEYREERNQVNEDSLSGLDGSATFFNALGENNGRFDVSEAFAEFAFPLLRNRTFAQDLTFEGAARFSDYSTVGSTFTWESRLGWQPVEQIRFRATHGEALRAPDIGELFSPFSQNFANINHPCDAQNLDLARISRDIRVANCIALGIPDPENFDARDEASIELLSGGNRNLREEKSRTTTIGFVWSPTFVDNLDVSVDYWDIEITDAIASTGAQQILNRCVDAPGGINNQFCDLFTLLPDGNIELLQTSPVNLNTLVTSGVDFSLNYRYDLGDWGRLRNTLSAQYLDERTFFLETDDDVAINAGQLGDPEWAFNLDVTWDYEEWSVFSQLRYIDSMFIVAQQTLEESPFVQDRVKAPARVYVDLGAGYTHSSGWRARFSVDNVTNELPPRPFLGNGGGSGLYDAVGRFYSIDLGYDF